MCQAVRVGFVRGHIERCFGMACIDADRRQPLCAQPMIEPHGKALEIRPGYKFNVFVDQDIVFPGSYEG